MEGRPRGTSPGLQMARGERKKAPLAPLFCSKNLNKSKSWHGAGARPASTSVLALHTSGLPHPSAQAKPFRLGYSEVLVSPEPLGHQGGLPASASFGFQGPPKWDSKLHLWVCPTARFW